MIINRYLIQEVAQNFAATLLILTLIIVGNTFVQLLSAATAGELPLDLLSGLLWYGSLKNVIRLMPVALIIGMMLAFGRLTGDSELMALRAAGMAPRHFYKAIYGLVLPLTLVLAVLVLIASPLIESQNEELRREIQQRPEAAGIPAGEFVTSGSSERNYTILAESLTQDNTVMERFFVRLQDRDTETIIWARSAILFVDTINKERFLEIRDGYRYENDPNKGSSVIHFSEHGIRIPLRSFASSSSIQATPTLELLAIGGPAAQAEIQWRISIILSAPLMAFLAFPMSYTRPRQGRYGKVVWMILIYLVYANVLVTIRGLLEREAIPAAIGMWWVHGLILILGFWLLKRFYGSPR
ncbi:LPS export ABC transporter permease LptF [Thiofilum flexile]|uniref:LPS export ABC transporter permease LptF n=1 Tax=Thiofilum flexile TaxID=125627 RepID=UPI00037F999C|nr:LPS export ABC transporter permease LptF [Thiofilum flexile]